MEHHQEQEQVLGSMSVRPDSTEMSTRMEYFCAQLASARAIWRTYKEWVEAEVLPEPLASAVDGIGVDVSCPPEILS